MATHRFITWKTEIVPVALLGYVAALSSYAYRLLPERVPTHWNFAGEVDGWSSRSFVILFFPLLATCVYLLFLTIWRLDPKRDRYHEFATAYHGLKALIVTFFAVIYTLIIVSGLGYSIPISVSVMSLIGLLLFGIGFLLPSIKQNWLVGIRTPWTLSSEKVWNETHAFGGKVFSIGGIVMAITAYTAFAENVLVFFILLVLIILLPVVYSYLRFRR